MRKLAAWALAVLLLCSAVPFALADTGTVTASSLVLRTGPSTESAMLAEIPNGTQLTLEVFENGWYRVTYGGKVGFVNARYVRVDLPSAPAVTQAPAAPQLPVQQSGAAQAAGQPGSGLPTLAFDGENNPGYPMVMKPGDSGNSVIDLQKTLQMFGYKVSTDGQYGYDTQAAVMKLQTALGITADGLIGPNTRNLIGRSQIEGVELLDWWLGGNVAFARLTDASVVDVRTGKRFRVSRYGGDNHCDTEPLTAVDAQIMLSICGGEWTWERRPVWLEVGDRVIAASMTWMPHEGQHVWNNSFDGHFCLHMYNSRTHDTDRVDEEHAACVLEAWQSRARYQAP